MTSLVPKLTSDAYAAWIDGLDAFILDCDGVLWRGDEAIVGAIEFVATLRNLGKRVVFVTNNSTQPRAAFAKKLASQGIAAAAEDIVTSAWATAKYMKAQGISGKVYFIGETGLGQELAAEGFEVHGFEDGERRDIPVPFTFDRDISAVVVGLDRFVSYYKLAYASCCIREIPGCRFISTNPDVSYPLEGSTLPGGGSFAKFVEATVGHPPEVVVGKPSQDLLTLVLSTYSLNRARTCMVGDILSTDIEFGRVGGLQTLLVLSGVTREDELAHIASANQIPHHYVDSVDVVNKLQASRR